MSNRAAVMPELGRIEIQERPLPEPTGREVVVRVEAVGVCGSDTAYFTVGYIGDWVVDGPIVLGHEAAGQVHAVGPDVTLAAPGDRVAIEPGTPCRDCRECRSGSYHLCAALAFLATPPYDGALVQHLLVDERNLFRIPDSMSYEEGALLEPLSVGIWACERTPRPGDDVLVTGAGPVGLLRRAGRSRPRRRVGDARRRVQFGSARPRAGHRARRGRQAIRRTTRVLLGAPAPGRSPRGAQAPARNRRRDGRDAEAVGRAAAVPAQRQRADDRAREPLPRHLATAIALAADGRVRSPARDPPLRLADTAEACCWPAPPRLHERSSTQT